jgi:peptide/nickel transport system permease protein
VIKVKNNIPGIFGIFIILCSIVCAVFAYFIAPDKSPFANEMHLELSTLRPGTEVSFLHVPKDVSTSTSFIQQLLEGKVLNYKSIPVSTFTVSDSLVSYTRYGTEYLITIPNQDLVFAHGKSPIFSKTFFLGTDKYGRDLLSRLIVATRISLAVGFISVFISLLIGITLGLFAGYYGSWIDKCILWLINVVWSIPTLLMVIAISLALGKGFWQVFVAVGLTMWVEVARVVRGQVLSLKQMEYIQAARVLGFGDFRIMFKHILPNIMSPITVISAANFASAILIEAGLSFLGIGAQAPMPSWGAMIKNHYSYIILDKAYLALAPGMAIMLLVLALMYVGNMLRERLNVRA